MDKFTFFDTEKDLRELTGIDTHEGLRDAGFDLDDWDWGFVSDNPYTVVCEDDFGYEYDGLRFDIPQYAQNILDMMENYCVGFQHTEYNGKHYYLLYHS